MSEWVWRVVFERDVKREGKKLFIDISSLINHFVSLSFQFHFTFYFYKESIFWFIIWSQNKQALNVSFSRDDDDCLWWRRRKMLVCSVKYCIYGESFMPFRCYHCWPIIHNILSKSTFTGCGCVEDLKGNKCRCVCEVNVMKDIWLRRCWKG